MRQADAPSIEKNTLSTVLVTWELGGGLGHLVRLLPLVQSLRENGHQVVAALRDLSRAEAVYRGLQVSYLQAPIKTSKAGRAFDSMRTLAHILSNCGFGDDDELRGMVQAWRNLITQVRPDLILFDHGPTALLASRGLQMRRVVIGTGFCCPPDTTPVPDLRPWLPDAAAQFRQDEQNVLRRANRVLDSLGVAPLERLTKLYHPVDETFLATFRELDQYPDRPPTRCWGAWPNSGGMAPEWPGGAGKRIYAYLKPFPARDRLLALLDKLRLPTLVYLEPVQPKLPQKYQSKKLRFVQRRLDLTCVGRECDLAILNGGHGVTASMLLAGVLILQLPIYVEQAMTGVATRRLGAGRSARIDRPNEIAAKLTDLIQSDKYARAAGEFSARYRDFDPKQQVERITQHLEELLR